MRTIGYRLLLTLLALLTLSGSADLPPVLVRGINITNWFRFPPSRDPVALRGYLDDATLRNLKDVGFTFVRLAVQPDLVSDTLPDVVARIQRQGLAVVVALFAEPSQLETWRRLAPMLRRLDPAVTFPELLNEPVFAGEPDAWARIQHDALIRVRSDLPAHTIVLSGADWSSVAGLLALTPEADPNVIYSFHVYEPAELTALGAYRTGLDSAAMAQLPFPVTDETACRATSLAARDTQTADLMQFYCGQRWDIGKVAGRIAAAGAWGRQHRVAVLAGEFGASQRLNSSARLAWLASVRQACEREGIGWALWGYDDSMGFAQRPSVSRTELDRRILNALALTENK